MKSDNLSPGSNQHVREVNTMVRTVFSLIILLTIISTPLLAVEQANTLQDNGRVPESLVRSQVSDEMAGALLKAPYKGFYQIESTVKNRKMLFSKLDAEQSFPDQRWETIALDIASLVQMPAYSTGSRIDPKATAYVVFYDRDVSGVEPEKVIYLPTSAYSRPNTLAVLLIEHDNHLATRDALGTRTRSADQNTDNIFFFELAM